MLELRLSIVAINPQQSRRTRLGSQAAFRFNAHREPRKGQTTVRRFNVIAPQQRNSDWGFLSRRGFPLEKLRDGKSN